MVEMNENEQRGLLFQCGQVFTPSAPINNKEFFAGRLPQLKQVFNAINTQGQHAIIFGERGVGKTSLANILNSVSSGQIFVIKVNCNTTDTFETLWHKVFSEVQISKTSLGLGFSPEQRQEQTPLIEVLPENVINPSGIRSILQHQNRTVIIVDEFDRLNSTHQLFADTIKELSDNSVQTTLILVGVARDIDELLKEHTSIDRCLMQIKIPRMTTAELNDIIDKAVNKLGMTINTNAKDLIVFLSNGLPHYTHLLGKESFTTAIMEKKYHVDLNHVDNGIMQAIEQQKQTIGSTYLKAITGQRSGTLYEEVLLACALAKVDEYGFFSSADVRQPLNDITGKNYDIPNFSVHLNKFSSDTTRGPVLEKSGASRRFRFRFINPLLQPHVIMKGLIDKKIDKDLLTALTSKGTQKNTLF